MPPIAVNGKSVRMVHKIALTGLWRFLSSQGMKLQDWMAMVGKSDKDLATEVAVDRSTVSRIRRGKVIPTPGLMQRIAAMTHGAVEPNDFVLTK